MYTDRATPKVQLYQSFFEAAGEWLDIFSTPLILFVFDTPTAEQRFCQTAQRLDSDVYRDIRVPFATSSLQKLSQTGLLGPSWHLPEQGGQDERVYLHQLNPVLTGRTPRRWA